MGNIVKQFDDLDCWKEARALVKMVYQATSLGLFARDFGLRDQIQRAAVSIMANIAEGFENTSTQEGVRFLGYATRSCAEVQSHLYVALDLAYFSPEIFDEISDQAKKCMNYTKALLRHFKHNRDS